jgi:protein-disulfide isomerase
MKKLIIAALLGTFAITAPLIAAKPKVKTTSGPTNPAWDARLTRTPEGNHLYGNPAAKVRLVEFISYTCPHCAHYAEESKAPLLGGMVRQGKVAVEIRPFFRNLIDVPASLLAQCGPDAKFLGNHHAILAAQSQWLVSPSAEMQKKWGDLDFAARIKTVAVDMGLYKLMLGRGYTPVQLDQCLSNRTLAEKLNKQTGEAVEKLGVQGTPSFLINGKLQDIYGWEQLSPRLDAALR